MSDNKLPSLPKEGDLIGGRFRITRLLGSGGFGTVFQALQENIGRDVALKFLAPSVAKDPVNIERFRREAFHVSQLRHPNTITLYDYGQTEDGLFYMVMELLEGVALSEQIQKFGAIEMSRGAHIFLQVLKSLTEAHQRGLVHRDLKPENIYLCEMFGEQDYVKVLDFGVAKMTMMDGEPDSEEKLTKAGRIFGTPMYMAPEQACAEPITPATDIYALGLLCFEILTGLPPVTGRNRMDVIHKQIRDEVPRLTPELLGTPIGDVIRHATLKDPAARYQDASQMWEAFYDAVRQMKIAPAPRGASRPDISIVALGVDPRATPSPRPSYDVEVPGQASSSEGSSKPPPLPPPLPGKKKKKKKKSKLELGVSSSSAQPAHPESPAASEPVAPSIQHVVGLPDATPNESTRVVDLNALEEGLPVADVAVSEQPSVDVPALPQLPLIGRDQEIHQLIDLVGQSMQARSGHIVLLEGERGVGKTRVAWTLREELFQLNIGLCIGVFRRGTGPLDTLREALADFWWVAHAPRQHIQQVLDADLGALGFPKEEIDFLVDFLRPSTVDTYERLADSEETSSLFARLERVLLSLAELRPMALVLEDIQYADSATLSFLEYFAVTLRTQSTQFVIMLTLRSGERNLNPDLERSLRTMSANIGVGLSRLRLKRLRGRELSVLLDAILPMEARLKERAAWLSQGNPAHAIQIVSYLRASDRLKLEQETWVLRDGTPRDIDLPPDLMDLMYLRVEQAIELSHGRRHLRETITWLALLGIRVPVGMLSRVMAEHYQLHPHDLHRNIEVLGRFGILHERNHRNVECVEFDNSLLRESLLQEVASSEHAAAMHAAAAELKLGWAKQHDAEVPLLEIAEHWRRAGRMDYYRDALFEAAGRSMRRGDPRGAREQYRELLRLLEERNEHRHMWAQSLVASAELSWRFGELGLAEDNYRTVLDANVLSGVSLAKAQRGLAHLLVMLGRSPESIQHYRAALKTSTEHKEQAGIAKALVGISNVHMRQGEAEDGSKVRERLAAMLSVLPRGEISGKVLAHLAEAARRSGDMRACQKYLEQGLGHYKVSTDRLGLSDTMSALAGLFSLPGQDSPQRHARAEKLLKEALDIKRAIGDRHGVAEVFRHLGHLQQARGDLEASEYYLRQSLRMHEALGAVYHIGAAANSLALVKMYAGDYERAETLLDKAIGCFERVGDQLASSHMMLNKGTLALNRLQLDEAKQQLERSRDLKEKLGSSWALYELYNHLAIVKFWQGDFDAAEELFNMTLEVRSDDVADEDRAIARSMLGLLRCFQSRLQLAALELGRSRADAEEIGDRNIAALCQANAAFYAALTDAKTVYNGLLEGVRQSYTFYSLAPKTWLELLEHAARHVHSAEASASSKRLMKTVARAWCDFGYKERGDALEADA